jgi:colanic acid/amylovoran biosynthesis glycosyltransferase
VANCEHFRRRAVALGASDARSRVIGSGLDTTRFAPGARRPRPGGPHLVAVGRLVDKKGFADAVLGVAEAALDLPDVTLEIVGDGPLRAELEALIARTGSGGRIALSGALPHEEVARRIARADIVVAPSVTAPSGDQDAPVNTLKEAMAMELPAIATRHGGIPELVRDGENGCLVPERDPAAIAAAIRHLAARRERWPKMGRAGRRRVVENYDLAIVTDRLILAYNDALSPREIIA